MFFEEKLEEEFACQKQVRLEGLERGRCWTDNSPLDLENETIESNENVYCLQRLRRHNIVDLCMQLPDQTKKTNISKTEIQYAWQKRKPLVKICSNYIQRASLKVPDFLPFICLFSKDHSLSYSKFHNFAIFNSKLSWSLWFNL